MIGQTISTTASWRGWVAAGWVWRIYELGM